MRAVVDDVEFCGDRLLACEVVFFAVGRVLLGVGDGLRFVLGVEVEDLQIIFARVGHVLDEEPEQVLRGNRDCGKYAAGDITGCCFKHKDIPPIFAFE